MSRIRSSKSSSRKLDAEAAGNGEQMDDRVGRAADRGIDLDRVLEGVAGQHLGDRQVFLDHLDDPRAGIFGERVAPGIDRRDRRAAGRLQAESLGDTRHRRGGAHGHAMALGAAHAGFRVLVILGRHAAGAQLGGEAPDVGAGADILALELAVQHRAAGDHHRRDIDAARAHDLRRRGFVATAQQDHAVERIGADRFLDIHRHQIAEQHGGRAHHRLAERHGGEFEREAAGFPDAALDRLGDLAEMGVARGYLGRRIGDADDRPAVEILRRRSLGSSSKSDE